MQDEHPSATKSLEVLYSYFTQELERDWVTYLKVEHLMPYAFRVFNFLFCLGTEKRLGRVYHIGYMQVKHPSATKSSEDFNFMFLSQIGKRASSFFCMQVLKLNPNFNLL